MELLSLNDIQRGLIEQYEALDGEIAELNMKASSLSDDEIDNFAATLNIELPKSFKELVLKYDFGRLSIGGVVFGHTGNYLEFLKSSNRLDMSPDWSRWEQWWGQGVRPQAYLMIANTDGYVILLNTTDGSIVAYLRSEDWNTNRRIADDFEQFVRGAGTSHFGRRTADNRRTFGEEIARRCGVNVHTKFWEELAQGIT